MVQSENERTKDELAKLIEFKNEFATCLKRDVVKEYHLRIKLNGTSVAIWREFIVPSNISLLYLGSVLVDVMGWSGYHLYQFIKSNLYYITREQYEDSFSTNDCRIMSEYALSDLFVEKGDRMRYEYDFGDSWMHDLWLKGLRDYNEDEEHRIKLLKGHGGCPPEDCGGVWGYEDILELLKKKRWNKEEREMMDWFCIDRDYNPEEFDMDEWEEIL